MKKNDQLRVAVLGAGGLGSKMGAILAETGKAEVWLISRNKDHIKAINDNGLILTNKNDQRMVEIYATCDPGEVGNVDIIFITVKAYDTLSVLNEIKPLLHTNTLAITFQNGLGNLENITATIGADRSVLGVTFQGATLLEPGLVADMGGGLTFVAVDEQKHERLSKLAEAYTDTTIPISLRSSAEVDGLLWGKLAMVSGFNPLAAVLRIPNGAFGQVEEAHSLSVDAIKETMAVANAKGIKLAFDPLERFEATSLATSKMSSGTLIDVLKGRKTEIDAISGAIAREGNNLNVATPIHDILARLGKAIEATYSYRVTES